MENVDTELLINLVRMKEYLYNKSHRHYKDIVQKENAWKEIAETLNCTSELCEKIWKSLKDKYTRERKKTYKICSGSGAGENKPWTWYEDMKFLDEFVQHRRRFVSTSRMPANDISEHYSLVSSYIEEDSQAPIDNLGEELVDQAVFEIHEPEVLVFPSTSKSAAPGITSESRQVVEVSTPPPSKRQKTTPLQKKNDNGNKEAIDLQILNTLSSINNIHQQEEKDFGNLVAYEIGQIENKEKRKQLKKQIINLIYNA